MKFLLLFTLCCGILGCGATDPGCDLCGGETRLTSTYYEYNDDGSLKEMMVKRYCLYHAYTEEGRVITPPKPFWCCED